jgi:hypothetical protein
MATKFTYKNEVGRKWDVGSGTRPTQTKLKKKKNISLEFFWIIMGRIKCSYCFKKARPKSSVLPLKSRRLFECPLIV